MRRRVKVIDRSYTNIPFVTYHNNYEKVIDKFTPSKDNLQYKYKCKLYKCKLYEYLSNNSLFESEINNLLSNKVTRKYLTYYNKCFTGYDDIIIKEFINCLKKGTYYKIVNFKVKKKGIYNYIIYNINIEKLLKYSNQRSYIVKDRALEFAGAFYHFGMFLLMYSIMIDELSSNQLELFMNSIAQKVNLSLLGGFGAYFEMEIPVHYSQLYEELSSIRTENEDKLFITFNPENETMEFKIRDSYIFFERYKYEGIGYEQKEKPICNNKYSNSFRITKGKTDKSIKFIYKQASGQETLGRIFGIDEEYIIHPNTLYDSGLYFINDMLLFCFRAIMDKCNFDGIKPSKYTAIDEFIKSFKGKRYITETLIVIALIAFNPESEEDIIKKYLINKEQRDKILNEVKRLRKLSKGENTSSFVYFLKQVGESYVW